MSTPFSLTWTVNQDVTPPTVPTALVISSATLDSFVLSWAASTDNVAVAGYEVECNGTLVTSSPITGTAYECTTLVPGTEYTVNVRAMDLSGNFSAWSAPASVTLPTDTATPTAATNLVSDVPGFDTAMITWSAASDPYGITQYIVYRNGTQVGTTGITAYVDTGLSANTNYTYTVVAVDAAGHQSAVSSALTVTTTSDPRTDSDHDGLPDAIETVLGTNPNSAATVDSTNQLQVNIHRPTL
jgi:chitinase